MKLVAIVWGLLSTGVQKGLLPSGRLRALEGLGGGRMAIPHRRDSRSEGRGRKSEGWVQDEELGSLAGARGLHKGQGRGEESKPGEGSGS